MRKKAINSYKDISKYIDKENYLFTVENVIKEYKAFKRRRTYSSGGKL